MTTSVQAALSIDQLVLARNQPSLSKDTTIRLVAKQVPSHHGWAVGVGVAASSPATYGDMSPKSTFTPEDFDSLVVDRVGSSDFTIRASQVALGSANLSGASPGDKFWVCLFSSSPSDGTAPIAVSGPFTIQA